MIVLHPQLYYETRKAVDGASYFLPSFLGNPRAYSVISNAPTLESSNHFSHSDLNLAMALPEIIAIPALQRQQIMFWVINNNSLSLLRDYLTVCCPVNMMSHKTYRPLQNTTVMYGVLRTGEKAGFLKLVSSKCVRYIL